MVEDILAGTALGLQNAAVNLFNAFVNVIPGLIAAVIIFLVGYIVAEVVKKIIVVLMQKAGFDKWIEDRKLGTAIGNAKISNLTGTLVKWWIIALVLAQALVFLNLEVLSNFLEILVEYIPIVAASIVLIVLGLLIGKYFRNKVESTQYKHKKSIGLAVEIIIAYIAIVLGLENIGFQVTLLLDAFRIAFTVFVVVAAVILGITFAMTYKKDIQDFARSLKR